MGARKIYFSAKHLLLVTQAVSGGSKDKGETAVLEAAKKEPNLTESAYSTLRADLLACRLRPGEKLSIASLSTDLGVSLGAVREALARLTAEGLVIAETNRGFRAAPVSESELLDLTSARIEMESACLRRAIRNGDVTWESEIVAAHHLMSRIPERASDDTGRINEAWAEAHRDFHSALVAACDSPWRLRLREFLYDQTERYRQLSVPALRTERNLAAEHQALMEATLARDEDLACKLLAEHLNITAGRVRVLAEPAAEASETSMRGRSK